MAGLGNYTHGFPWDILTQQCINLNGGLAKPPLKLEKGLVITSNPFICMSIYLLIHAVISMLVQQLFVTKINTETEIYS